MTSLTLRLFFTGEGLTRIVIFTYVYIIIYASKPAHIDSLPL